MSDTEALVRKYVKTWAEPDAELRRKAIAEIWAEDGVYKNAGAEYVGHKGIEQAVTEAYEAFVPKGFSFRVAKVDVNHEAVRYVWEVIPPGGGEPNGIGTQVAIVGEDGRLVRDHQFIDQPPSLD